MDTHQSESLPNCNLKEFTTSCKTRYIVTNGKMISEIDLTEEIRKANEILNKIIQCINLKIITRNIPYINLNQLIEKEATSPTTSKRKKALNSRARFVVFEYGNGEPFDDVIKKENEKKSFEISYLLSVMKAMGGRTFTAKAPFYSAKLVVDKQLIVPAIVDTLLDSAMYNSYFNLRNFSVKEKKIFSEAKYEFYKTHDLPCCLYHDDNEQKAFFSLAFSARKSLADFDINQYINLWEQFMYEKYPDVVEKHKNRTILEQLERHLQYKQLEQNLPQQFQALPPSAYLLLRINKVNRIKNDRTTRPLILSEFGLTEIEYGKTKIIQIGDYEKFVRPLANMSLSSFKVIVD